MKGRKKNIMIKHIETNMESALQRTHMKRRNVMECTKSKAKFMEQR